MAERNWAGITGTFLQKPISRRKSLIWGAIGVASLGALAATKVIGTCNESSQPLKPPENLPDDVLSEEELKRANITIYNTKDVVLYIRSSALEMPAFSDAAEGKIGGLVIALVGDQAMTWDALDHLPPDARLIAQSIRVHPSDFPQGYWDEYFKHKRPEVLKEINKYKQDLADILSGKTETYIKEAISNYQKWIKEAVDQGKDPSKDQESLAYWQEQLRELQSGELEKGDRMWLSRSQEDLKRIKKFEKDPKALAEYLLKKPDQALGQSLDRQTIEDFIANTENIEDPLSPYYKSPIPMRPPTARYNYIKENHPEWLDRSYFYICVGKQRKPHPSESFQGPNDFDVSKEDRKGLGYHVTPKGKPKDNPNSGFALRHEIGHYGHTPDKDGIEKEAEADDFAFQTLVAAWEKYNQTDDNSGYSFVFVTKEGLTYTRNLESDKPQNPEPNTPKI